LLTFRCSGSLTVSVRLFRALRICEAATLVEVFSKACIDKSGLLDLVIIGNGKVGDSKWKMRSEICKEEECAEGRGVGQYRDSQTS
jgi:hypothetical protein